MKLEIRILIASAFVFMSLQAGKGADAVDCSKNLCEANLLEKDEKVNLMPIPLRADGETNEADSFKFNKRQQELADLWDATLERSQDIQFVIHKLLPNYNDETSKIAMRMISTAVFGGMGGGMMMVPNMGSQKANVGTQPSMYYMALTDANLESSYPVQGGQAPPYLLPALAKAQGSGMARKARLNDTESIMLFKIVRDTADTLVSNYKDYSQAMQNFADGHDNTDKDMRHVLTCRAALVGLAGEEVVTKLDESNGFTKLIKQFEAKSH